MSDNTIDDAVRQVIADYLAASSLPATDGRASATFDELGIDSISIVDLTAKVEKRCSVQIPDRQLPGIQTVGDLVDTVRLLRGPATAGA